MNEYYLNFFSEFEKEYQNIKTTNSDSIVIAHKVTGLIETRSKELFKWLKKHKFSSPEEEIYFFKDLKPIFISKLISSGISENTTAVSIYFSIIEYCWRSNVF